MRAGYKLYVPILLAAFFAVALCEESVEVSVDNEPVVDSRLIELQNELKVMKAKIEQLSLENNNLKAQNAELSSKRDQRIAKLTEELDTKERERVRYSSRLDQQHERLMKLQNEKEELQRRFENLRSHITFLDVIVDMTERYIIPAALAVWEKVVETWHYGVAVFTDTWRRSEQFYMTNETVQLVKQSITTYWALASQWCINTWNTNVKPFLLQVYEKIEPYYLQGKAKILPIVTPYLQKAKEFSLLLWMRIKAEAIRITQQAWVFAVTTFEQFYTYLKASPVQGWAEFIAYLVLVAVLTVAARVVLFLVFLPVCFLCPCRRCPCCK